MEDGWWEDSEREELVLVHVQVGQRISSSSNHYPHRWRALSERREGPVDRYQQPATVGQPISGVAPRWSHPVPSQDICSVPEHAVDIPGMIRRGSQFPATP